MTSFFAVDHSGTYVVDLVGDDARYYPMIGWFTSELGRVVPVVEADGKVIVAGRTAAHHDWRLVKC